jgi:hypothetical protein
MSDDGREGMSPSARALLAHANAPRARTAAERARTAKAVARIAAAPAAAGGAWLSWKGALLAAVLVAGAAGVTVARRGRPVEKGAARPAAVRVAATTRADAGAVAAAPRLPDRVSAPVVVAAAARPAATRVLRSARAVPAAPVAAETAAPSVAAAETPAVGGGGGGAVARLPEDEQRALERARGLLRSDPAEALRIAEAGTGGRLAEERELIALEALQRLGRTEALRARSEGFLRSFPRSLYAERVRRWVGP